MSKKVLSEGLSNLLGDTTEQPKKGRPKTNIRKITKSSQEGTPEGENASNFHCNGKLVRQVKSSGILGKIKDQGCCTRSNRQLYKSL